MKRLVLLFAIFAALCITAAHGQQSTGIKAWPDGSPGCAPGNTQYDCALQAANAKPKSKKCAKGEYLSVDGRCLHDQTGESHAAGDGCNTMQCMDPACRMASVTALYCLKGDDPAPIHSSDSSGIVGGGPTSMGHTFALPSDPKKCPEGKYLRDDGTCGTPLPDAGEFYGHYWPTPESLYTNIAPNTPLFGTMGGDLVLPLADGGTATFYGPPNKGGLLLEIKTQDHTVWINTRGEVRMVSEGGVTVSGPPLDDLTVKFWKAFAKAFINTTQPTPEPEPVFVDVPVTTKQAVCPKGWEAYHPVGTYPYCPVTIDTKDWDYVFTCESKETKCRRVEGGAK